MAEEVLMNHPSRPDRPKRVTRASFENRFKDEGWIEGDDSVTKTPEAADKPVVEKAVAKKAVAKKTAAKRKPTTAKKRKSAGTKSRSNE